MIMYIINVKEWIQDLDLKNEKILLLIFLKLKYIYQNNV